MRVYFSKLGRNHMEGWQRSDKTVAAKIDELINDIQQNGYLSGKGKPEQLRHFKDPVRFSRRITRSDRLVYCPCNEGDVLIISCKGHYED